MVEYKGMSKEQGLAFQFRGKKIAVQTEVNKSLESIGYNDLESNLILQRLKGLIDANLAMCSDNLAIEVIVNIPGVSGGVVGADGVECRFRHCEVAVRPLWGFCELVLTKENTDSLAEKCDNVVTLPSKESLQ